MFEELKFDKKLAKTHSKQRCFVFFLKKKLNSLKMMLF